MVKNAIMFLNFLILYVKDFGKMITVHFQQDNILHCVN